MCIPPFMMRKALLFCEIGRINSKCKLFLWGNHNDKELKISSYLFLFLFFTLLAHSKLLKKKKKVSIVYCSLLFYICFELFSFIFSNSVIIIVIKFWHVVALLRANVTYTNYFKSFLNLTCECLYINVYIFKHTDV